MKRILLLTLAVISTSLYLFSAPLKLWIKDHADKPSAVPSLAYSKSTPVIIYPTKMVPLDEIEQMLQKEASSLDRGVINKTLTTLRCADEHHVAHNQILTIIDYSLPSSQKRLWVFDLQEKKLLFHTYVSHGIKSGLLSTQYFSNKYNSKASSIGVFTTDKAYYGREGISLRLSGLERGFNDNASNRSVVMHGGWYMDERFIKKYGRPGRSWGCPAIPLELSKALINTIKENSLFVVYYPNDRWLSESKFLNCHRFVTGQTVTTQYDANAIVGGDDAREGILFANLHSKSTSEENEAVVAMSADNYRQLFHTQVPLTRMLRRQINQVEYIALSDDEFKNIAGNQQLLNNVYFVVPHIKMLRGYYETEMRIVPLGKIREVRLNSNLSSNQDSVKNFTVYFDTASSINLHSTNKFIRWVGL